ncbi:MAG TPA: hypothetical protein VFT22_21565 [Kofleriaceae bacterium]|nr:hypothetical protein [Kofleriaceae bacterium]
MTDRRDLKRRIRERQARTGESYMTALRHVRGQRAALVPVVELVDVTQIGDALGFKCPALVVPALAERIDVAAVFRQLRDALIATASDPASELMRAMVLHGERPSMTTASLDGGLRFMRRARAGIGGFSDGGAMLALNVQGRQATELVIFMLWISPRRYSLILTSIGSLFGEGEYRWDVFPYVSARRVP